MKVIFSLPLLTLAMTLTACQAPTTKISTPLYQTTQSSSLQYEGIIHHANASNHVRIYSQHQGVGEYVLLLPSLGRGVADFTAVYLLA